MQTATKGVFYFTIMSLKQDQFIGLPDWVNFLAVDEDGHLWGYEYQPVIIYDKWQRSAGSYTFIVNYKKFTPDWKTSLIERQKQLDYKSLPNLPEWVNYLAIDENGEMWGYEKRPYIIEYGDGNGCWVEQSAREEVQLIETYKNYSGDWKTSLIERQKA